MNFFEFCTALLALAVILILGIVYIAAKFGFLTNEEKDRCEKKCVKK